MTDQKQGLQAMGRRPRLPSTGTATLGRTRTTTTTMTTTCQARRWAAQALLPSPSSISRGCRQTCTCLAGALHQPGIMLVNVCQLRRLSQPRLLSCRPKVWASVPIRLRL